MSVIRPKRLSNLQLSVLRFYRETLKYAYTKPEPTKSLVAKYLREQFQIGCEIPRKNFSSIEHHIRVGKNRFTMIKEFDQVDGISFMGSQ